MRVRGEKTINVHTWRGKTVYVGDSKLFNLSKLCIRYCYFHNFFRKRVPVFIMFGKKILNWSKEKWIMYFLCCCSTVLVPWVYTSCCPDTFCDSLLGRLCRGISWTEHHRNPKQKWEFGTNWRNIFFLVNINIDNKKYFLSPGQKCWKKTNRKWGKQKLHWIENKSSLMEKTNIKNFYGKDQTNLNDLV